MLIECPTCKAPVSRDAKACPHCGVPLGMLLVKRLGGGGFVVLIIAVFLALGYCSKGAASHPGRMDAQRCHAERATGDGHCHGARPRSRAEFVVQAGGDARQAQAFPSCAAAREAGGAPMRRGSAGYSAALDPDADGVACE